MTRPYKQRSSVVQTFEGSACKRCQGTTRYKSNHSCVSCARAAMKAWAAMHREQATIKTKERRDAILADPIEGPKLQEVERQRSRQYYDIHKDSILARKKEWYNNKKAQTNA